MFQTPTRNQIKLLCHYDNNLNDSSVYNRTPLTVNASISYVNGKFDKAVRLLRTKDMGYINYDISDVDLSGDFTLDYWFYAKHASYWGQYVTRIGNNYQHNCGTVAEAGFYSHGVFTLVTQSRMAWHHAAICRSDDVVYYYIDGTNVGNVTDTADFSNDLLSTNFTYSNGTGAYCLIDEYRLVAGRCLIDGNFTPPTTPYTIPDKVAYNWVNQPSTVL